MKCVNLGMTLPTRCPRLTLLYSQDFTVSPLTCLVFPSALDNHHPASCCMNSVPQIAHISEIMQHLSFSDTFILFLVGFYSIQHNILRMYPCCNILCGLPILPLSNASFHGCTPFPLPMHVNRYLDCNRIMGTVNSAATNTGILVSLRFLM